MGLFKPIWEKDDAMGRKNMDKALAAVAKMTDQAKLADVRCSNCGGRVN